MVLSRAALALALAMPLAAAAYESVETDTINTPDQGGHGSISAVLDGRSGNTDREAYTVGGRVDYRSRETDMFLLVEHSHATALTPEQETEDSSWAHARYRDEFKHALAAEAFVDARKDDFQLLDLRTQFGLGVRFTLNYAQDVRAVYAGIGVLHEWEDQANQDDHYWRLNPYFTYKRQLSEQLRVLAHLNYQPRMDDSDDFLVASELALLVRLSPSIDLKLGVRWQYDGEAPAGIEADDTRYLTSLRLSF